MGLEIVEFVMAIEEEFDIRIPDIDAGDMQSIPQVIEWVDRLTDDSLTQKDIKEGVLNLLSKEFGHSDLKGDENLYGFMSD